VSLSFICLLCFLAHVESHHHPRTLFEACLSQTVVIGIVEIMFLYFDRTRSPQNGKHTSPHTQAQEKHAGALTMKLPHLAAPRTHFHAP